MNNIYMKKIAKSRAEFILLIALLFISVVLFSLFVNSQQTIQVSSTPSIPANSEIKYYGYKYANYSSIIVSTKAEISCAWKPDSIDDGWKNCEAIFEVENLNSIKPTINTPNINFSFLNS
ncbi:MAG: hypothetical protein AABY22_31090, partial [Nanoarchaeota archaeon]